MKFSPVMIAILVLAFAFVGYAIFVPSPQQQAINAMNEQNQMMLDQMNQQNQQMQMQNMQMLNGMQTMVYPNQNAYSTPGYYQQAPAYQEGGYAYPNNGGYAYPNNPNNGGYPVQNGYNNGAEVDYTAEDQWGW